MACGNILNPEHTNTLPGLAGSAKAFHGMASIMSSGKFWSRPQDILPLSKQQGNEGMNVATSAANN